MLACKLTLSPLILQFTHYNHYPSLNISKKFHDNSITVIYGNISHKVQPLNSIIVHLILRFIQNLLWVLGQKTLNETDW